MATETTTQSAPKLIALTPKAIEHVKILLERQEKPEGYLRIAAVGGGCSGLSYKLSVEDEAGPSDYVFEEGGLKVLLDMKSSLVLAGMELDYNDDLMNAGFAFRNPNATHTCGCGTSFGV
jgi:iron-sulfur cluster assembly protein